ncbi:DUF4062 domain-containing protein [Epilithonimonas sp. JDS]|uniref:DUF4062 domain-containing protein n=1 Tax=Epilithonimonas sp. JDS TaxID=2902797 RepID=UPI001E628ACF|nr:DUF4062 domain-containing protein [Epilithonimonas sp. JDS]MCD9855724.1 DUF4062 domain-containing protein [Epilithonimonas sp. JDS]
MYQKKYQVFISSTYKDLVSARDEAIKVILNLYQIPIGMEMFSADNDEQWNTIQSTIENSDYYLLILGHRYGSITNEGVSYTEKEFDYAKSLGVPIISFVKSRNVATTPNQRDADITLQKSLDKFLTKVTNNSMCDFWDNDAELGQKIAIALTKIFFKTPRIGWVKSNLATSLEATEEITKLVKENRELRESLERYKAISHNDIPAFEVKINNNNPITLKHDEIRHRKYESIRFDDVPTHLLKYITKDDIDNFNNDLITNKKVINEFIEKDNFFQNFKNNALLLNIEICNIGNAKANDVYIDFKFSEDIALIEKEKLDNLDEPDLPNVGINPIEKALKEYNSTKLHSQKFYGGVSINSFVKSKIFHIPTLNKSYHINEEKNILTIKTSKITHTRIFNLSDTISIAALKKGKYEIEINIICDEITSPVIFTKEIFVE